MTTTFKIDGKITRTTRSEEEFLLNYFILKKPEFEVSSKCYYSLIKKGIMRKYAGSDWEVFPTIKGQAILKWLAESWEDYCAREKAQLEPTFIG